MSSPGMEDAKPPEGFSPEQSLVGDLSSYPMSSPMSSEASAYVQGIVVCVCVIVCVCSR